MIKGNSRTYSLPIFKMFIQHAFHLTIKKNFAGEIYTGVWVQFDSPPKSPEGGSSTLKQQFSLVEGILGSLTNC